MSIDQFQNLRIGAVVEAFPRLTEKANQFTAFSAMLPDPWRGTINCFFTTRMVLIKAAFGTADGGNAGGMSAMDAFVGMNMARNTGDMNTQSLLAMGQQPQQAAPAPTSSANSWICACGTVNKGKLCAECEAKKPVDVPQYRCDKCG